jgi:heme oxygenase
MNETESISATEYPVESAGASTIDCLREETSAAHSRIDTTLHLVDRLSVVEHRRPLLVGYHLLHRETESKIAPFLGETADLDFSARRRSSLIAEGLGVLGQNMPADNTASLDIRSRAQAFGALYVLEGSSLGGRIILKELKHRGVPLAGLGFLDPYGTATGQRWRSFIAVLEREVKSGEQKVDAVRGALNTFAFAELCLGKESIN